MPAPYREYRVVLRHDPDCFPCGFDPKTSRYFINDMAFLCSGCELQWFGQMDIHLIDGKQLCTKCAANKGTPVMQSRLVETWTDHSNLESSRQSAESM